MSKHSVDFSAELIEEWFRTGSTIGPYKVVEGLPEGARLERAEYFQGRLRLTFDREVPATFTIRKEERHG